METKALKVVKVVVFCRKGYSDAVSVILDGTPNYPEYDTSVLKCECLSGTGVAWVKDVFGVEPEVIVA